MPTYALLVTRVSYYAVEAPSPDKVWDAYIEAEEMDELHSETTGHQVFPADPFGHPTGDPLVRDATEDDEGDCPACGESIVAGEDVVADRDGETVHAKCEDLLDEEAG